MLAASIGTSITYSAHSRLVRTGLATLPARVLEEWAAKGTPLPDDSFVYAIDSKGQHLKPVEYKKLDLNAPWESFDFRHELTMKGIQKFVADYEATLRKTA